MYCYNCEKECKTFFIQNKMYTRTYCSVCESLLINSTKTRKYVEQRTKVNTCWLFFTVILFFAAAYLGGQ